MSLPTRFFRRSVFFLVLVSAACAAQTNQFLNLPQVELTGGRVTSFQTGLFQQPASLTDILYINAPVVSGNSSSVTVGLQLNGQGFFNLGENQITFPNTSKVVAALGDFNGDGLIDFAFALTSTVSNASNLCIYFGTGSQSPSKAPPNGGGSSFNGGNFYPPQSKSGCITFATALGNAAPSFGYIAALPFKTNSLPQLLIEDSANNNVYLLANSGATGSGGVLTGISAVKVTIPILVDGAGPIYTGDFNGDGNTDFILNGQSGNSASVYFGNGDGTFKPPVRYVFDHNVHSMLLQDMDGDGHPDMVVEGDNGVIEIFHGNPDGSFGPNSKGGTAAGVDGFSGNGGHLAAINPSTLDILTTTPIGLSVLQNQGALQYSLKGIYNIGPGRSSFALANFFGSGLLDLVVDSAEGVAVVRADANGDGGFQTSNAYSALAPALGAVIGKFKNPTNNPQGYVDVVVATGAVQGQWMAGLGNGKFLTAIGLPTNRSGGPNNLPATLWSNMVAGDFNGDGNLDLAYSLTGLPLPAQGSGAGPGLYIQYGNGDSTFQAPIAVSAGAPANNVFYGESVVGDFNGDGLSDLSNIDAAYDDTLIGLRSGGPFLLGLNSANSSNTVFNQVASGFFKVNRTSQQDLVFQQGASFIPYVNKQDGTGKNFTAMAALTGAVAPYYASTVLLTDVDHDGNGDLVVVYYNTTPNPVGAGPVAPNQVYIWWGNGDGTFQAPLVLSLSRDYYLGAVADINTDGLPDLLLSDGSLLSVLYNQGGRSFGSINANSGLYTSEQHYLAGQGINSITLASVSGNGTPDLVVANGGATISNAIALGGATQTSLNLTPNPDVNTGGITVLLNAITTQPVTATLVAAPEPSSFGATFTMTATITPSPGVALPTGTVTFSLDGNPAGTGTLAPTPGSALSSTATFTIPVGNTYASGVHPMTATYSGDSANSPLAFSGLSGTHLIQGGTTTTTLYLCIGPTPTCPAGYVMPPFASSLQMYYGQYWNGTVRTIASDGGALPGTDQIFDAYTGAAAPPPSPLCILQVVVNSACAVSVGTTVGTSAGINVITATYVPGAGDTHTGSTSAPVTITVLQDTTAATLTGAPNPSPANQPVTFTATLTGNYAPPTGPVVFTYGNTVLGTGNLVASATGVTSTASITTSALPVGVDTITATYASTVDFAAASATFQETITPSLSGSFTLNVTPNPVSLGVGYGTLLTVTVTGQNGFVQGVNLACGNLPNEVTCFFVNAAIPAGGGPTSLLLQTTAPHTCGTTQPYFVGGNGGGPGLTPFALPALAGLAMLFLPGRRRWLRALLALIVAAGLTQMTGCTTCTDLGTRPATYTFQVTGSSTGSSEVEAQTVTLTVTL